MRWKDGNSTEPCNEVIGMEADGIYTKLRTWDVIYKAPTYELKPGPFRGDLADDGMPTSMESQEKGIKDGTLREVGGVIYFARNNLSNYARWALRNKIKNTVHWHRIEINERLKDAHIAVDIQE